MRSILLSVITFLVLILSNNIALAANAEYLVISDTLTYLGHQTGNNEFTPCPINGIPQKAITFDPQKNKIKPADVDCGDTPVATYAGTIKDVNVGKRTFELKETTTGKEKEFYYPNIFKAKALTGKEVTVTAPEGVNKRALSIQ